MTVLTGSLEDRRDVFGEGDLVCARPAAAVPNMAIETTKLLVIVCIVTPAPEYIEKVRECSLPRYLAIALVAIGSACSRGPSPRQAAAPCQSCHPAFYEKWSASYHGLAMRPFTAQLARANFPLQNDPLKIGPVFYRARFEGDAGYIEEDGPQGKRQLPIAHVMGGKNTYYLLTPLERGRLQVLPLAFDVHSKKWYDMATSGVRMHGGERPQTPLPWTDSAFTFNTSCYGCHTSQIQTNYNAATDSYHTSWNSPGINCETCHGDAANHDELRSPNRR